VIKITGIQVVVSIRVREKVTKSLYFIEKMEINELMGRVLPTFNCYNL